MPYSCSIENKIIYNHKVYFLECFLKVFNDKKWNSFSLNNRTKNGKFTLILVPGREIVVVAGG